MKPKDRPPLQPHKTRDGQEHIVRSCCFPQLVGKDSVEAFVAEQQQQQQLQQQQDDLTCATRAI